ncbi:MAG: DUF1062 domain-containing protein [Defluviitaleaceae bacterium]|nr:DUF1062 domain-containing protein [Defluviitaleaceae bacterium]
MLENHDEVTWCVIPKNTPLIIRHCSKCNKKMEYYCSEKFRINSNSTRLDIWLIYKCSKCDTTLKLSIYKGIRPNDIPRELFDHFTHNDINLAWDYAFDRDFLKRNDCAVKYMDVKYYIEGFEQQKSTNNLKVNLKSKYFFDLKLSKLLAYIFDTSISKIKCMVMGGLISISPPNDVMKYRIKSDIEFSIHDVRSI